MCSRLFSVCDKLPTAGLPDHALVEDQSEDIATDVKLGVRRLEETQVLVGLASHMVKVTRQVVMCRQSYEAPNTCPQQQELSHQLEHTK